MGDQNADGSRMMHRTSVIFERVMALTILPRNMHTSQARPWIVTIDDSMILSLKAKAHPEGTAHASANTPSSMHIRYLILTSALYIYIHISVFHFKLQKFKLA